MAALKTRYMPCALAAVLVLIPAAAWAEQGGDRSEPKAKNLILFIGDGMGAETVRAAGLAAHGSSGSLVFEVFPRMAYVSTRSADSAVTDSAAAATAMATGRKVSRGVLSRAIPGDGGPLRTVLEIAEESGKSAGLVTTTYISHATPAAFGSHVAERESGQEVISDYLTSSRPALIFGGAEHITPELARAFGYTVIVNAPELDALDTETATHVSGQFGRGHMPYVLDGRGDLPSLAAMTRTALRILDGDPDGFFLMVEAGRIDHAAHANDIGREVAETLELDAAVTEALLWAGDRNDTLIVVTADHETGGLRVLMPTGIGSPPVVSWTSHEHTAANVPLYATGPGAERIEGPIDNTAIFTLLIEAAGLPAH